MPGEVNWQGASEVVVIAAEVSKELKLGNSLWESGVVVVMVNVKSSELR